MKAFAKYDFYIQLLFFGAAVLAALSAGILYFYFVTGIPQLISFAIRAFQKGKKSIRYIIYGIFIIPVWISLLIVYIFKNNHDIINFFGYILILSLFYSPILALFYVFDNTEYLNSKK